MWLRYDSHSIDGEILYVTQKDIDFDFYARIDYRVCADCSSIEKTVVLENKAGASVTLEQFFSGALHFPHRGSWRLTSLTGKWADEYRITREPLRDGQTVLQTRSIFRVRSLLPLLLLTRDLPMRNGALQALVRLQKWMVPNVLPRSRFCCSEENRFPMKPWRCITSM